MMPQGMVAAPQNVQQAMAVAAGEEGKGAGAGSSAMPQAPQMAVEEHHQPGDPGAAGAGGSFKKQNEPGVEGAGSEQAAMPNQQSPSGGATNVPAPA